MSLHEPFDTGLRQAQSLLRANGQGVDSLHAPFGLSLSKPRAALATQAKEEVQAHL